MKSKRIAPIAGLMLLWGSIIAGDWYFRFERFRWQDQVVIRAKPIRATVKTSGPDTPLSERVIPETKGGDLTRLAAAIQITDQYGEIKPLTRVYSDEHGYRNQPPTDHFDYPILVVGDSFMHVQYGENGSYAHQLAARIPEAVYNHAYPGQGAFRALRNYLTDGRFDHRRPAIIVWGLLEREIGGVAFVGYLHQLRHINQSDAGQVVTAVGSAIQWQQFEPDNLSKSLLDTSIISAGINRLWNILRYPLFKSMMPAVVLSMPDEAGNRQLFYRYTMDAMKWTESQRDAGEVARSIAVIREHLLQQGTELLILLIPDKPQVYREQLPGRDTYPLSTLYAVEAALVEAGVPVLNVLPAFQQARLSGQQLYWRDDTHWRPEAMAIAAEMTAALIQDYLNNDTRK